jgi:hypothetical protein
MDTPDKVMTVPTCFTRDFQVAERTKTLLGLPEPKEQLLVTEILPRFDVKPFLKWGTNAPAILHA